MLALLPCDAALSRCCLPRATCCLRARSAKIGDVTVAVGSGVLLLPDNSEDAGEEECELGLVQALWQDGSGG